MRLNNSESRLSADRNINANSPESQDLFDLFGSKVRVKILWEYLQHPDEWLGSSDLERLCECSQSAIFKQMGDLNQVGLLKPNISNDIKQSYRNPFKLNKRHPWIPGLRMIFEHAMGSIKVLNEEFSKLISIDIAFVHGSFAKSTQKPESDVDIIIIGHQSRLALSKEISELERRINRRIDYKIYTPDQWREKWTKNDHFVRSLMFEQKIFLVGDNERLERITSG